MDHSENDCFVMCILTHGDDGFLYSKNSSYRHDDIFSMFTAEKCKSLAGKPKLFFIQVGRFLHLYIDSSSFNFLFS